MRMPAGYDAVRFGRIRLTHRMLSTELRVHVKDYLKLDPARVCNFPSLMNTKVRLRYCLHVARLYFIGGL